MKQRWKLVLLSLVMIIVIILVIKQSVSLYRGMGELSFPTPQSRQDNPITVHRWMTVGEVADRYSLTEKEVYDYLQIIPEPGDEKRTLRELKIKYRKTSDEMQMNLQRIMDSKRTAQSP